MLEDYHFSMGKSLEKIIEMSKLSSTTGFFHVVKQKSNEVDQGFIYRYTFYDEKIIKNKFPL